MARTQVTVKILKSKSDVLWYRNCIGKEMKVKVLPKEDYYEIYENGTFRT